MKDTIQTEKDLNKKADPSKNEQEFLEEKAKQGSDTVTVCCGIAMGVDFQLSTGVCKVKGVPVSHLVSAEKGNAFLPAGKYGTTVIKRTQWEEILAKWGNCDFIKNGIIFAEKNMESAQAKGVELKDKITGFEQADPKKGRTKRKSEED